MPFGSLSINSKTYAPRSAGVYVDDTCGFSDPDNSVVVRLTTNKGAISRASFVKRFEKDVTTNGVTVRHLATVSVSMVTTDAFTAAELAAALADLGTFGSSANISRVLMGEQ